MRPRIPVGRKTPVRRPAPTVLPSQLLSTGPIVVPPLPVKTAPLPADTGKSDGKSEESDGNIPGPAGSPGDSGSNSQQPAAVEVTSFPLTTTQHLTTPRDGGKAVVMMDLGNAGEMVTVGTQILKLGAELAIAQKELAAAQTKVSGLEDLLRPLVARHAELIQTAIPLSLSQLAPAGLVASAAPQSQVPPPALNSAPGAGTAPTRPAALSLALPGSPAAMPGADQLKNRVKEFLRKRPPDESVSATDVAEALHIDSVIVREAMLEIRHGR